MKRSLLSTIILPIDEFQRKRIEAIDAEDFSGVRRKVREELHIRGIEASESDLDEGILALRQYYAVALLDPKNQHAVSAAIDPYWHAHILHTRQYVKFCDQVFGQYIHHEPLDHQDSDDVELVARLYRHTAVVYRQLYGYINASLYPVETPSTELVCKHYEVTTQDVRQHATLPALV